MAVDIVIDRHSPVPLYFQLSQQLEAAIRSGRIKAGERIDTEVEIAERYGLSRPTVRQAISELVNKGLLVRRRGVGTQVVHDQMRRPVELTSLYEHLEQTKRKPGTRVLDLRTEPADAEVAAALQVAEGTEVLHLERLRLVDGEPLAIMRNWLPADLVDLQADALEHSGLYDLMRRQAAHRGTRRDRRRGEAARAAGRRSPAHHGAAVVRRLRTGHRARALGVPSRLLHLRDDARRALIALPMT